MLKEKFPDKNMTDNDSEYYSPKYFKLIKHPITGEEAYEFLEKNKYNSNYWSDRDKGNWDHMPKIYDDECEPFY